MKITTKRLLTLLLSLVLVLSLIPVLPVSAESYSLFVCGTQVTSSNSSDVLGDGKVTYLPGNKYLYIKGDLTSASKIIENSIDGLTVYASKSDNSAVTLTSTNADTIVCRANTVFRNSNMIVDSQGSSSTSSAFFVPNSSTMSFVDSTVTASANYTICGTSANNAQLSIRNSNLTVSSKSTGGKAVVNFNGGITLNSCYIIKPVGGKLSSNSNAIVEADGNTHASYVEISDTMYYDLWIAGTQVTSKNQYNVLGDGVFQFYEPKTLSIKGDCTCVDTVIYNEIDGLVISTGAPSDAVCQLISQSADTIVSTGNLTFSAAKLSLSTYGGAMDDSAIYMKGQNSKLTFAYSDVYAYGDYTVYGENGTKLDLSYTNLKVDATDRAIAGFSDGVTFDNCYLDSPAGAVVNENGIMGSDGSTYAQNVVVKKGTYYGLRITGVSVNTYNCSDVLGDGVFKYDNASKKLTINGNCSYAYSIINSEVSNLKIVVKGDSKLTTTSGASSIFLQGTTVIQAENGSKLTVESGNAGINLKSGTGLEFQNLDLTVTAPIGIIGNESASLSFTNSVADITATNGAVYGFQAVNLTGCVLAEPTDGRIDGGKIVNSDGSTAKHVVIGEPPVEYYDLYICGVQVSSENKSNVLGDGVFSYNPNQKRLTLSKSMEGSATTQVVNSSVSGLTIYMPNDFTLRSSNDVLSLAADTRIIGPGTLTVISNGNCGIFMRDGATLTLDGADVVVQGKWGIAGQPGGEKLIVKNSHVVAKGSDGAICDFDGGITLDDVKIVTPEGGKVAGDKITDKNGTLATEVEIIKLLVNPFVDVIEGKYYYDHVLWAYYHSPQVTNGTDATHFSPDKTCTRGQVVTFLWRANGCPAPSATTSPFVDVQDSSKFYYKAVLWAVEKGITAGTDTTHFSPDGACTRGHVVTFLWRAKGKPAPATTISPFTDVQDSSKFYYSAVLWAVENNVTTGTSPTTFAPGKACTRGQVVTFLHRADSLS